MLHHPFTLEELAASPRVRAWRHADALWVLAAQPGRDDGAAILGVLDPLLGDFIEPDPTAGLAALRSREAIHVAPEELSAEIGRETRSARAAVAVRRARR